MPNNESDDDRLAELLFRFRERAAIREFDGGMTRALALFNAANELRKAIAPERLPDEIIREVNEAR
jgi:hypothetical protein